MNVFFKDLTLKDVDKINRSMIYQEGVDHRPARAPPSQDL
jgi:hypothetical protein